MNPPPKQPQDEAKSQQVELAEAVTRRRQNLLSMRTPGLEEVPSLGEILLPFLFAAMETCWIDAIFIGLASFGLFGSHAPLMPLWAPFVFIVGSQWILSLLERRSVVANTTASDTEDKDEDKKTTLPGSSLFILFVCVTGLFVTWLTIYTPTAFFLDPSWLLALLNDILFLNAHAYHVFFIVALILYFCWRGVRLLNREYQPSQVFGTLRLGMGIIIAVILVRAGQASSGLALNNDFILLLLIPVFLFLSLAAHALARVTFVRHTHLSGLEGDVSPQERSILLMIGLVGAILLITAVLVDVFASPVTMANTQQLFTVLGQAYDWFVGILVTVIAFLVTPLFWLIYLLVDLWHTLFPAHAAQNPSSRGKTRTPPSLPHSSVVPAIVPFVKILFPVLLLIAAILLMRWIVRRRRRVRVIANRRIEERRESLWSWALFWAQFKALFLSLFRRFFPQRAAQEDGQANIESIESEPAARSIREIYRALLKRAAKRGYPRKRDETPYEFKQRLDEKTSLAGPQLAVVTEAYTAARYGGIVPDEAEVARIRREWATLEQKWRETSGS